MPLAKRARMLRRPLALALLGSLAWTAASGSAAAAGAFLPGAGQSPIEQRVAIAAGPVRTTLWTSLRFNGAAGAVGVVVPVPPLSALDLSSDAWMEALEVATAPRVFPPGGISPYCPGESGDPDPFHVAGSIGHAATLAPAEVTVLPDAGAVALWAASNGLSLAPEVASALGALQNKRFVAARFTAPGGAALTKTLRVAMPGGAPALPLALTRAGAGDVLVTAWLFGSGRAALPGTTQVTVEGSSLTWNASALDTDYAEQRMGALAGASPDGALLESASHEALSYNVVIPGTSASIDGVVTTYFERADAYGDASGDPASCTSIAASALASSSPVSASCPRADYGVVDGSDTCAEAPAPGDTDPERLRCGPVADDIAVGLSGLTPSAAWLTRYSLRIAAGQGGADWPLSFGAGSTVTPVLEAGSVSVGACGEADAGPDGGGSSTGTGMSSTSSGGQSTGSTSPSGGGSSSQSSGAGVVYEDDYYTEAGCDCSGTVDTVGGGGYGGSDDEAYSEDDGCSSDTTSDSSSDDGCGSDTTSDSSSDDGCGSDTTSDSSDDGCSSDTTSDSSSDDCSGDSGSSSSDGCSSDSGGSSDGCDSGSSSGGDSCSSGSGSGEKCSITADPRSGVHKRRSARLSPIALAVLALLAPIRRAGRKRRGAPAPGARP
jgi:hypothetical protein